MVDLNDRLLGDLLASLEDENRNDGLEWFQQNERIWSNLQSALSSSKSSLARGRLLNVLNQSIKSKSVWLCSSDEEAMTKATRILLNHLNRLAKDQSRMPPREEDIEVEAESIGVAFYGICSILPKTIQQIAEEHVETSMGSQLICTVVLQLFIQLAEYQEKQGNLKANEQKDYAKAAEQGVFREASDEQDDLKEILLAYSEWISELAFYVLESNNQDNNKSNLAQKPADVQDRKPLVVGLDLQRLAIEALNKYAFNSTSNIKKQNQSLITDLRVTAMTDIIPVQALRDGALTFLGLYLGSLPLASRPVHLVNTVTKLIQDQIPDDIDVLQEIQNLEVLEQSRQQRDEEHPNNPTLIDKFLKMCAAANSFAVSALAGFSLKDESQLTDCQVTLLSYIQRFSVIDSIREKNAQFFIDALDAVFKSAYQGEGGLKQQSKNSLGSVGVIGSCQSIQEQHAKQDEQTKTTEIVQSLIYCIMSYFPRDQNGQNGFEITINGDGSITTSNGSEDIEERDHQQRESQQQDGSDGNSSIIASRSQSSCRALTQLLQQLAVTHYEILHQVLLAKFERLIDGSEWNTANIQSVARALAVTPHLLDPALNKRFCITVIRSYLNLIETRRNRLSKALIINGFFHCGLHFKIFVNANRNVFETLLMKMIELLHDDLPALSSMSIFYLGEMCRDYSELLLTENRAKEIFLKEIIATHFKSIYLAEKINVQAKLQFLERLCELVNKSNEDGAHQELQEELFVGLTADIKSSLRALLPGQISKITCFNSPEQQLGMLTLKACKIISQHMPKLFQKFCGEVFVELAQFKISAEEQLIQRLTEASDDSRLEEQQPEEEAAAAILELIQVSVEIIAQCYDPADGNCQEKKQSKRKNQLKVTNESGSLEIEEVPADIGGNDEMNQQDTLAISVEKIITAFLNNNNKVSSSLAMPPLDLSALMLISKKVLRSKCIDTGNATMASNNSTNDNNLQVAELLKLTNQLASRLQGNANDDEASKYRITQVTLILNVLLEIAETHTDLFLFKLMEQVTVNNQSSYTHNALVRIIFEQFSAKHCQTSNVLIQKSLKILVLFYEASAKSLLWKSTSCAAFKEYFLSDTLTSLIPPRFKLSVESLTLAAQILACLSTQLSSSNQEFMGKVVTLLKESISSAISNSHARSCILDRQTIQAILHLTNPKKIEIELLRLRAAVVTP